MRKAARPKLEMMNMPNRPISSIRLPHALTFILIVNAVSWAAPYDSVEPARADLSVIVEDLQGASVAGAKLLLSQDVGKVTRAGTTGEDGQFAFHSLPAGSYHLTAATDGFVAVTLGVTLSADRPNRETLQFTRLAAQGQSVAVTAAEPAALSPDPVARAYLRDNLPDAAPARPGTPVLIPGLPVETASGGIKAPQYFAPGVAGDHGEPIAQFFRVGNSLIPNNLPANAHGNGYSDPSFLISRVVGTAAVDSGAFSVREGNNAVNLATTYGIAPSIGSFLELSSDSRDAAILGGWGFSDRGWLALEADYGNGFLRREENRRQFKFNAYRTLRRGRHELSFFTAAYSAFSYIPGLIPRDVPVPGDTVDPRQAERTNTAFLVAADTWQTSPRQQFQFAGFLRSYQIQLRSNFGDGLIQQSESRMVVGGNAMYSRKLASAISVLAGLDLRRDAPRGLDLKHLDANGVFQPVTSNDINLQFVEPYVALDGSFWHRFHYDFGVRREEILFTNFDRIIAANSFNKQVGITLPKGTATFLLPRKLPKISISYGDAFHTNDPRIGQGTPGGTLLAHSRAGQLTFEENLARTEFRIVLSRISNTQQLAKIDPDTGLQLDLGPSLVRAMTISARHAFSFGYVQASFARADAEDLLLHSPVPEAPRLIWDILGAIQRLPYGLQFRGEFEYVGAKPLDSGFRATPVPEFRGSLSRSFREGRMDAGLHFLLAHGYTGQTVETLQLADETAPIPRVVGVPLKSFVSLSFTYHFARPDRPASR